MCGISGIFAYRHLDRKWPREKLQALLDMLGHRGPDDRNSYCDRGIYLGHTRLAVLDLSSNARQPMVSRCGRYVVTFNGEIFNFREIRRILQQDGFVFRSGSDTEVLAEAWSKWQRGCLQRLDGMFAFAVFDKSDKALFLARDPFGIKPLFYSDVGGELRFASEPLPF
jgi:asparagine synthase (glutamine-hydrolysing)